MKHSLLPRRHHRCKQASKKPTDPTRRALFSFITRNYSNNLKTLLEAALAVLRKSYKSFLYSFKDSPLSVMMMLLHMMERRVSLKTFYLQAKHTKLLHRRLPS